VSIAALEASLVNEVCFDHGGFQQKNKEIVESVSPLIIKILMKEVTWVS